MDGLSFECDFCGESHLMETRRVVAMPRPSDPTELVATMWACRCRSELPKAEDVAKSIEETGEWEGRKFMFYTL